MSYLFLKHNHGLVRIIQLLDKTLHAAILVTLVSLVRPASAQQGMPSHAVKAVVELFTSQGCASCPPADELMCEYAREKDLVVLTMPVTCWDYLGWKDTLANEKFTSRQRTYAKMRGIRRIYTPQAIINGQTPFLGSDAGGIQKALTSAASTPHLALPMIINILPMGEDFRIEIFPSSSLHGEKATILLVPFYREKTVAITGGENRGQNASYMNVVRDLIPLAPLSAMPSPEEPIILDLGRAEAMPYKTDGFAILVQKGSTDSPGRMLGAASFVSNKRQPSQ